MISLAIALIGFWLLATTAIVGAESAPLLYSDLICGALFIAIGLFFRRRQGLWIPWAVAALGLWLSFAPLIFWAKSFGIYLNSTLAGVGAMAIFLVLPVTPHQLPDSGPSIPPGWTYNPSSWAQRIPILFFAFICWMISRYLSSYQLGYIDTVWDPFFHPGTSAVLTSSVSKAFPVSDAGLGALAYTMETLSVFGGERRWRTSPWLVLIFGLLTIPLAITSTILIMLQPVIVGTWCTLCLTTAFFMLIPISLAIDEVAASLQYLFHSKEKPFFRLLLEGGKCPGAVDDSRSPTLEDPLSSLLKASLWGVTLPWNLVVSFFLGLSFMIFPALFEMPRWTADGDHILGALITVVSIISTSEVIRSVRYVNMLFAALLIPLSFGCSATGALFPQLAAALAIGILAKRKGPIRESTQFRASADL